MLVLTRKAKEQIVIGENITITLVRIQGNSVRIGIEAPREMRVIRGELAPLPTDTEADAESIELPERVFAHPQPKQPSRRRVDQSGPEPSSRPELYVGSVGRDGGQPQLRRAPLSDFMSAT